MSEHDHHEQSIGVEAINALCAMVGLNPDFVTRIHIADGHVRFTSFMMANTPDGPQPMLNEVGAHILTEVVVAIAVPAPPAPRAARRATKNTAPARKAAAKKPVARRAPAKKTARPPLKGQAR